MAKIVFPGMVTPQRLLSRERTQRYKREHRILSLDRMSNRINQGGIPMMIITINTATVAYLQVSLRFCGECVTYNMQFHPYIHSRNKLELMENLRLLCILNGKVK